MQHIHLVNQWNSNALSFFFFFDGKRNIKKYYELSFQTNFRITKMKNSFHTLDSFMSFHFVCRLLGKLGFWVCEQGIITIQLVMKIEITFKFFTILHFSLHNSHWIEGLLLFNHDLSRNVMEGDRIPNAICTQPPEKWNFIKSQLKFL